MVAIYANYTELHLVATSAETVIMTHSNVVLNEWTKLEPKLFGKSATHNLPQFQG